MSLLSGTRGAIAAANGHAYADLVMDTGPVAWWPLDGNLLDRKGPHHGSIGAGAESSTGTLPNGSGRAFNCAGTNWISVSHAAVLKPAVGSLMAWFKPAMVHDGIVMAANAAGTSNPSDFALRADNTGTLSCFFQQGGVTNLIQTASPYYQAGQIVHALVTFGASGFTLYLDGNKIASSAEHTGGFTDNTLDWRFGNDAADTGIFNGVIDEIAIWDRVLTRNEIYLLAQTEPD
jgi:hypothetical protein